MSITGAADADGGGPTKVGVAISDVVTGLLGAVARPGGARRPGRAAPATGSAAPAGPRPADRHLAARARPWPASSTRPRTRSSAASRRAGSATPTRTSSRTRRSRPPTATIAVAVGRERQWPRFCACARAAGAGRRSALRHERRPGRATGPSCARSSPRGSPSGRPRDWLAALDAAEIPCGPINDIVAAFASPEAAALGMTVEQEHPAWGVDPPGRPPVPAVRARRPRSGRRRRSSARTPTRSSPSWATDAGGDRGLRRRGVV